MNAKPTPDDFTPVDGLLVPPRDVLEPALGYDPPPTHNPRWLAVFWEPAGDEARYADGRIEADAYWPAYQAWLDFGPNRERLQRPCEDCGGLGQVQRATPTATPAWAWDECEHCLGLGFIGPDLGSSDGPASHWLILDRDTRRCFVASVSVARTFLASQWPPPEPVDPEHAREFYRRLSEALKRAMENMPTPTQAEIEAAMVRDRERLTKLQDWLKVAWARAELDRAALNDDAGDLDDPNYVPF